MQVQAVLAAAVRPHRPHREHRNSRSIRRVILLLPEIHNGRSTWIRARHGAQRGRRLCQGQSRQGASARRLPSLDLPAAPRICQHAGRPAVPDQEIRQGRSRNVHAGWTGLATIRQRPSGFLLPRWWRSLPGHWRGYYRSRRAATAGLSHPGKQRNPAPSGTSGQVQRPGAAEDHHERLGFLQKQAESLQSQQFHGDEMAANRDLRKSEHEDTVSLREQGLAQQKALTKKRRRRRPRPMPTSSSSSKPSSSKSLRRRTKRSVSSISPH